MAFIKKLAFRRRITYLTVYSINTCGVFPIKAQASIVIRYAWVIFTTFEMLYMCGLSMVAPFFHKYDFTVNSSIVLNVLTSLVCYCNPVISLWRRRKLIKLIRLVDTGFYTYTDEATFEVREYSAEKLIKTEIYLCGFVFATYVGMTLGSVIMITMFLKDHVNSAFDLVYVAWVPFGIETKTQFVFNYMMQWISTIPLYTSFISKILLINHINKEIVYQCNKLEYALRTICDRIPQQKKRLLAGVTVWQNRTQRHKFLLCDETEFLAKLRECEYHYYRLQKCLHYFSSWFNLIFSCELTYGFLSFALIGYVLIQGTGNRATDIKYLCLLGLFGGQLCYQCVAGDMFLTLKDNIAATLYDIPWYNQSPTVKKNVQMFLQQLQHGEKLRGFKLFPATIQIFTSILRTSYSYLNILNKIIHSDS